MVDGVSISIGTSVNRLRVPLMNLGLSDLIRLVHTESWSWKSLQSLYSYEEYLIQAENIDIFASFRTASAFNVQV